MKTANSPSTVSKTLLIPLVAWAGEAERDHPVIEDRKAAEILSQIDAGGIVVDGGEIATLGILARTKVIDNEVGKMLAQNPGLTILNLGAGLDTRISRMDNGRLRCYDLDLPEVIALRRRFFMENDRIRFIAGSILDRGWTKGLETLDGATTVIIAEGQLMYFPVQEVKQIFHMLPGRFPGAHMLFDVVHSYFVGKGISSGFQWGIDKAKNIRHVAPRSRLVRSWSTGNLLKERQSPFFRVMNILPGTRNRSQILHILL